MFRCKSKRWVIFLLGVVLLTASFLFGVRNTHAQGFNFLQADIEQQLSREGKEVKMFYPQEGYQQIPLEEAVQMEDYSPADQYVQKIELKPIETQEYMGQ